jgi:hypothetical protein
MKAIASILPPTDPHPAAGLIGRNRAEIPPNHASHE